MINAHAQPGDIIAFCPDQLGPAVYRVVDHPARYTMVTFPRGTGPPVRRLGRLRQGRARRAAPIAFAAKLVAAAGTDHRIWLVWQPGYQTYGVKCETLAADVAQPAPSGRAQLGDQQPAKYYEPMNLTEYAPRAS